MQHTRLVISGCAPSHYSSQRAICLPPERKQKSDEKGINEDELMDVVEELENSAYDYEHAVEWFVHMKQYRKALIEKIKSAKHNVELSGVRLMTFHASKGLEFNQVYILDANEGITPHKKAVSSAEIEEERRMFYVAMTRAKDRLIICSSESNFHKEYELSSFVKEIMDTTL